jgi:hypothetical protein
MARAMDERLNPALSSAFITTSIAPEIDDSERTSSSTVQRSTKCSSANAPADSSKGLILPSGAQRPV